MLSFKELNLIAPILKALDEEGYSNPTPIQAKAIPLIVERKDILGCAQTGTGKTAAFALPVIQMLATNHVKVKGQNKIRALILTPTRELAVQVGQNFTSYAKHTRIRHTVIYGGVSPNPQKIALQKGVDILIATPGRLKDLMSQGFVDLRNIEFFILDEADRMLDMGFIHDIKTILTKLPSGKQSLFFTATLSAEINRLASSILINPEKIEVTPVSSAASTINQSVYFVDKPKKKSLLLHLLNTNSISEVLLFTRMKHHADRIARDLSKSGIKAQAIHGGKSQNARERALSDFKAKKIRVLVATDIAARGIDIEKLSHVINYELPNEAETYIHRIGRTGRAGETGHAISFCDKDEREYLKQINKLLAKNLPVVENHPFSSDGKLDTINHPEKRTWSKKLNRNEKKHPGKRKFKGQKVSLNKISS